MPSDEFLNLRPHVRCNYTDIRHVQYVRCTPISDTFNLHSKFIGSDFFIQMKFPTHGCERMGKLHHNNYSIGSPNKNDKYLNDKFWHNATWLHKIYIQFFFTKLIQRIKDLFFTFHNQLINNFIGGCAVFLISASVAVPCSSLEHQWLCRVPH